jgi:hypothetical protein
MIMALTSEMTGVVVAGQDQGGLLQSRQAGPADARGQSL